MACHFPAVSVVPVVPVRPLENEIPCGRSANFQWHSLRATQPLEGGTPCGRSAVAAKTWYNSRA